MSHKKERNLHKQAPVKAAYDVKPVLKRKLFYAAMSILSCLVGLWMVLSANLLVHQAGGYWVNFILRLVLGAVLVGFGTFWYSHTAFDWIHVDNQTLIMHRFLKKPYTTTFKQLQSVNSLDRKAALSKMPKEIEIQFNNKESIVISLQKSHNGDKFYQDIKSRGVVIHRLK